MSGLERPIYLLLQEEPFFAHFILGSRVVFDDPRVKTAGASIIKGEIIFLFNTEWFFGQNIKAQIAVLKHEVLHVLLDHCGARGKMAPNKKAANIAMDCAINQHINNLPEGCATLKRLEKELKRTLLPLESWEYYYNEIKEAMEDKGEVHDHDVMHGGDEVSDLDAELARIAAKDAAGKAIAASHGNVPDYVSTALGALGKAAKIPWKQKLRNLISSARVTKTKNTRMKPNRRFELEQPGKKKIRQLILGVCVDSSGSVSDESFAAFMAEIYSIAKSTKITYLVHADADVQKVDIIKDGKAKKDVLTTRHGRGGTLYQPAIDECTKRRCDAIIYFGDFDTSDIPKDPGVPFIWVGVGTQPSPAPFGKVLRI